jgi:hypothetical protein
MLSSKARVRLLSFVVVALVAGLMFGITASPAMAKSRRVKHRQKSHEVYEVRVIRKVAARYKLPKSDVQALIKLAYRESSWNPRCITGSYRGLFQIRTHSKGWSDPFWNTARAIRDIQRVYKTPRRALAHSYSQGWY